MQALATLRKRVDGLTTRECNKETTATTNAEAAATMATEAELAELAATATPAAKITAKKTTPTTTTKNGYTQKECNTIPRGPIIRGNGSTKSRTWLKKN